MLNKKRLDLYVAQLYPNLSRSLIQKYIKESLVTVDDETVTKPRSLVSESQSVQLKLKPAVNHEDKLLPIIYIDDNVIVVDKPSGILTHSKGTDSGEFTVADFFKRYSTYGSNTNRPGVVHRLDRGTSGIIIGARNDNAALMLKKQFSQRRAKKTYTAVVTGVPKVHHAVINLPIGRNPSAPSTFRVDPGGKPAETTYDVVDYNQDNSLVKLEPKTGRTHQLRVHLQYINTPILGDHVYGKEKAERLMLHASSLELTIPGSKRMVFSSTIPDEFFNGFSVKEV